ncbi:MAG TPA: DUF885 domain-containing protein, partial [Sphingomicrobium sp.]|nr:DUF885 domain-containing protein [Sphingomicrobium sp.]
MPLLTRRETMAAIAASAAISVLPGCKRAVAPEASSKEALGLLEGIADHLLRLYPEGATSLGVDTGALSGLRSELEDRSAAGQSRIASVLRDDLARAKAFDPRGLDLQMRTNFDVVRSAYETALEGFSQPYGDVAVGGWRNTPYVVIQNVGAWLDVPQLLNNDQPLETKDDAEAYLSRLAQYPKALDGELERLQAARGRGLVPPKFLIEKTLPPLTMAAGNARSGGAIADTIARKAKAKGIAGNWEDRARHILEKEIAPALERQVAELKAQSEKATDDAGMWARPDGEAYYRWALKAGTTTTRSPEEIHQMGVEQLKGLHSRMDSILKQIGYGSGSVGERMKALAKDPKYKFSDGDQGRAEIMAFIQDRLKWINAQLPRAFNTLVHPNMEVKRMAPEEEPGAPTAYGGAGSIDGKIPGRFWINLRSTDLHRKYA